MKTITFYSYKGGTGRTLALANLAMCLSRLGRNVCVLDFDFEAPSLHHKFADFLEKTKVERGAIDYIWDYIVEESFDRSIKQYTCQIKPEGKGGVIHFIPAGLRSPTYWKRLASSQFHQTFCFLTDDPGHKQYQPWKNFCLLNTMKDNIANQLNPKPDYLLIDSRSGIMERSGVCIQLWANTVVYFLLNNPASLEGTYLIFRKPKDVSIFPPFDRSQNHVFVLTRVPVEMEEQRGLKLKDDILKYLNEGIEDPNRRVKEKDICVLHSDRELELKETLYIKAEGLVENVLLSHEYINLFTRIIPEEAKGFTQIDHIASFFRQALGLAESVEEVEKVFRLSLKEGEMFNPIDKKRNVSLRSETLCGMLDKIYNKHIERSNKEEVDKSFFDSGRACGESFGKELMEEVWKETELSIQERLDKWCAFDSLVGLGKFLNEISETDREGHIISGKIILKNNPFAFNRSSTDPNLCSFMTGYIEGVLTKITDTNIEVTHNQQDCMQYQPGKKECDFYFRRVE